MKKILDGREKPAILGLSLFLAVGLIGFGSGSARVQANNTAQTLPFSQNWTTTSLITTNDDWSAVPGIVGYLGDIASTSTTNVDPRTLLSDYSTVSAIDVIANQTNPDTLASGGVAEFDGIANPTIALQGSATADAPYIIISLNTTGKTGIKFACNIRDIDASADDAAQQIDVQYRVGGTGNYVSVAGGYIADATTASAATQVTALNLTLPAAADNKALVEIRVMTTNAAGSDEWVGIDDINISAAGGGTTPAAARGTLYDFTGNGRTDWTTLKIPTSGPITWKIAGNPAAAGANQAFIRVFDYGVRTGAAATNDVIVPQDYDGDAKTEPTVWRPGANGVFYVAQFPTATGGIMLDRAVPFGTNGDSVNAVGDYDGDGKIDYAVARLNNNGVLTWYAMSSSTNTMKTVSFGVSATTDSYAVVNGADFNGDGRDEVVFISLDADNIVTWYAGDIVTGAGVFTRQFGDFNSDYLVTPADYTGDKIADLVVVRQASAGQIWYINNSAANTTTGTTFGIADTTVRGDIQVRGDYDGDGRQDIAVWRASSQTFYYISSANGSFGAQKWGDAGDTPLGSLGIFK